MISLKCQQNALDAVKAFAKSDQELPSSQMVAAVNDYFNSYVDRQSQMSVQSAIYFRKMAAIQMSLRLIRGLAKDELEKADKALYSIAETFASIRWVGGEWRAYVARDGRTADRVIDEHTAKDFKLGRLSMGELINRIYPDGIPLQMEEQKEHRIKGWRR